MATSESERKSFFKRISGKENIEEESEMTFFDHIEELRWHIMRSIIAWLAAAIAIFIYIAYWIIIHFRCKLIQIKIRMFTIC